MYLLREFNLFCSFSVYKSTCTKPSEANNDPNFRDFSRVKSQRLGYNNWKRKKKKPTFELWLSYTFIFRCFFHPLHLYSYNARIMMPHPINAHSAVTIINIFTCEALKTTFGLYLTAVWTASQARNNGKYKLYIIHRLCCTLYTAWSSSKSLYVCIHNLLSSFFFTFFLLPLYFAFEHYFFSLFLYSWLDRTLSILWPYARFYIFPFLGLRLRSGFVVIVYTIRATDTLAFSWLIMKGKKYKR